MSELVLVDFVGVALVVTAASALQTAVGFGMGLVTVPCLIWLGHPLPTAVAILLGAALVQTGSLTWVSRHHVRWRSALLIGGCQWLAVPIGVMGMRALAGRDPALTKQVIGLLVLVVLAARALARPRPRPAVHPAWAVLAGVLSGLAAGLSAMGGPPLVIYAQAHDWDTERFRAFLWSLFFIATVPVLSVMVWTMGTGVLGWFALGVGMAPCLWIGARFGLSVSARWSRERGQLAATTLLVAIGVSSGLAPYL